MAQAYVQANRRRRIASALAELVHEKPAVAVTTGNIVARAQIARNTFYETFSGKEQAVRHACSWAQAQLFEPLQPACAKLPAGAPRTNRAIAELLRGVESEPLLAELCLVHAPGMLGREADLPTSHELLAIAFGFAVPAGEGDSRAIEAAEFSAAAVLAALAQHLRRGTLPDPSSLHDELAGIAMHYCSPNG